MLRTEILIILLSGPLGMQLFATLGWIATRRWDPIRREQCLALLLLGWLSLQPFWLEPWVHGKVLQHRDWQIAVLVAAFLIWNAARRSPERRMPPVFYWHTLWTCLGLWLLAAVTVWPDLWMPHISALGAAAGFRWLANRRTPTPLTAAFGWPVALLLVILLMEAMQAGFPAATLILAAPMLWHGLLSILPLEHTRWQPHITLIGLTWGYPAGWWLGWEVLNHDLEPWQGILAMFTLLATSYGFSCRMRHRG